MTKKIAILTTDDFEDSELSEPYERLKDAGYKVLIVGPAADKPIWGKRGKYQAKIDVGAESVTADDFDILVIPGGYAPDRLRLNAPSVELVREFGKRNKPIAAICHGPQLLISAGLAKGRKLTGWMSIAVDLINAGAEYVDEPLVIDGNSITSRKPSDLPQFIDAIIAALEEDEKRLTA